MALTTALLVAACCVVTNYELTPEVVLEVGSPTIHVGDPVYLRVRVRNNSREPITIPAAFARELGTLRFSLYNRKDFTFHFRPLNTGSGLVPLQTLPPGQELVMYDAVAMPPMDNYDPSFWRAGEFVLSAYIKLRGREVSSYPIAIQLSERPAEEHAVVVKVYDGGIRKRPDPVKRGAFGEWKLPALNLFGLETYPPGASTPEQLDALYSQLSPGGLRDAVRLTILTRDVYGAEDDSQRQRAVGVLATFVENMAPVERELVSRRLVAYFEGIYKPQLAKQFMLKVQDGAANRTQGNPNEAERRNDN